MAIKVKAVERNVAFVKGEPKLRGEPGHGSGGLLQAGCLKKTKALPHGKCDFKLAVRQCNRHKNPQLTMKCRLKEWTTVALLVSGIAMAFVALSMQGCRTRRMTITSVRPSTPSSASSSDSTFYSQENVRCMLL